jgi:hypothetical protein
VDTEKELERMLGTPAERKKQQTCSTKHICAKLNSDNEIYKGSGKQR